MIYKPAKLLHVNVLTVQLLKTKSSQISSLHVKVFKTYFMGPIWLEPKLKKDLNLKMKCI
jgi:hypothetical protein